VTATAQEDPGIPLVLGAGAVRRLRAVVGPGTAAVYRRESLMIGSHGRNCSGGDGYGGGDVPGGAGMKNKSQKGVLCGDGIE
jgi:hypothetical protein